MQIRILGYYVLFSALFLASSLSTVHAQKNIGEILEEKAVKGSGMKTRSFSTPKPQDDVKQNDKGRGDEESGFEEISKEKGSADTSKEKASPPEEDVWKKYKSIASGSESKALGRRSYSVGNGKERHSSEEESELSEEEQKEFEAWKAAKKEKSKKEENKGGLGSILDDYKKKQKTKASMRSRSLNE